jgi:hypothetical protein
LLDYIPWTFLCGASELKGIFNFVFGQLRVPSIREPQHLGVLGVLVRLSELFQRITIMVVGK